MKTQRSTFSTLYEPGPAWLAERELEEQPGWPENLEYWRAQARSACLRLVGAVGGKKGTVLAVWYVAGIEEAERLTAETPLVKGAILKAQTVRGGPVP